MDATSEREQAVRCLPTVGCSAAAGWTAIDVPGVIQISTGARPTDAHLFTADTATRCFLALG